jgi:hypothetical protein
VSCSFGGPDETPSNRQVARKLHVMRLPRAVRRVGWAAEREVTVATARRTSAPNRARSWPRSGALATWRRSARRVDACALARSSSPRHLRAPTPSDEELLAFLDVVYDARRVDA